MDQGRLHDLARLQQVMDDTTKPNHLRLRAHRTRQTILKSFKDRKLVNLRRRLIAAARNFDEVEEWKIANQIKDHLKKEKMERYS